MSELIHEPHFLFLPVNLQGLQTICTLGAEVTHKHNSMKLLQKPMQYIL